jgi:uncharacterized membrane protein YccC
MTEQVGGALALPYAATPQSIAKPSPMKPVFSRFRYAIAAAIGVTAALVADWLFVPVGWRLLLGLGMSLSLGFAGVFFAAMTDPRLRR